MSSKKSKDNGKKNTQANGPSVKGQARQPQANRPLPAAKPKNKMVAVVVAVIAIAAIGFLVASGGFGAKKAGALKPTPEEAKYLGRYLPAGYAEPTVGEGGAVTQDIPMAQIQVEQTEAGLSIPVDEITSKRNVGFSYTKADGTPVALIAYVKPSGKLFVAVSYCVPCKGTSHTMTTDGNMTCDACGTKRDAETGVGISGACKLYPMDELPVTVKDGKVIIESGVLEGWTEQPTDRQVG